MEMYFVALVAPEDINQQLLKWKKWMLEKYQCEVALRSPAHITLIPPFWMKPELEKDLVYSITEFSSAQNPFLIHLLNFSCFKPRVLFVDVVENIRLKHQHDELEVFLLRMEKFSMIKEDRPFHPHLTIATRDLRKKAFYEAWEHFKKKEYAAEWITEGISLLKHNKKNWDVLFTSQFQSV